MLGGFLALLSAATFAFESATARRGVLTATVSQALAITIPLGVPIFLLIALLFGALGTVLDFSPLALGYLALAGVLHFVWGRYCNYRGSKAMGANLVAPVQQCSLIVTLTLAIWILGEHLTPLRLLGIMLVVLGPAMTYERSHGKAAATDTPEAALKDAPAPSGHQRFVFKPNYAEGYLFALLSSTGYGVSPVLVRLALESGPGGGVATGVAGGLVSYLAAAAAFGLILLLPGQWRHVRAIEPGAVKWFAISGVGVCFAQMLRYMALSLAPVSAVAPIQRLSMVFRLYFGRLINPQHEVFSGRMIVATFVSLTGALALSVSTELVQSLVPLPDWVVTILNWQWP